MSDRSTTPVWLGASLLHMLVVACAFAGPAQWYELPLVGDRGEDIPKAAVLDLVPFDGRLYVRMAPKEGTKQPIVSYDPKQDKFLHEAATGADSLGSLRVVGKGLLVPEAAPSEGGVGYLTSAGGGKWERVSVEAAIDAIEDVAQFDAKTFLAGSHRGKAVVAWRAGERDEWHVEQLTRQATRFSRRASRFLVTEKRLFLLTQRYIAPGARFVAPMSWGAWYVLRYYPEGSERGFRFDGPPCPTRALCLLAPQSSILTEGFGVHHEHGFGGGLVYVVLGQDGLVGDPKGALFSARVRDALPWCGETLVAERVPHTELARGVAVSDGACFVLLAEATSRRATVVVSRDLKEWRTIFDGEVPDEATAIGVLNGVPYVGLMDGRVGKIEE